LNSFYPKFKKFLNFYFIDDLNFHKACSKFKFCKFIKGEDLLENKLYRTNCFFIILKGKLKIEYIDTKEANENLNVKKFIIK
jgi:hypothetical protein